MRNIVIPLEPTTSGEVGKDEKAEGVFKSVRGVKSIRSIRALREMEQLKKVLPWHAIDLPGLAKKHRISYKYLRFLSAMQNQGRIRINEEYVAQTTELTEKEAHEKQLQLLREHRNLLMLALEDAQVAMKKTRRTGKKILQVMKRHGAEQVVKMLAQTTGLIAMTERGYLALLDEYRERLSLREKRVGAVEVSEAELEKNRELTTEEAVLKALGENCESTPETNGTTS